MSESHADGQERESSYSGHSSCLSWSIDTGPAASLRARLPGDTGPVLVNAGPRLAASIASFRSSGEVSRRLLAPVRAHSIHAPVGVAPCGRCAWKSVRHASSLLPESLRHRAPVRLRNPCPDDDDGGSAANDSLPPDERQVTRPNAPSGGTPRLRIAQPRKSEDERHRPPKVQAT